MTPSIDKKKQPKFSRMSLNVLMIISTVLIVILYVPKNKEEMITLPTAPSLNIQSWLSDSGAQIWFSPYLTDQLEIQLWYKAGYRYDGEQKGSSHLLAQLLKYESRKRQLPMEISLDQDFIKDEKMNVAKYVSSFGDIAVTGFKRVSLG